MKFGKLLGFLLSILLTTNVLAGIVTMDNAGKVARNFIYEQLVQKGFPVNINDIDIQLVEVHEIDGQPAFYAFNIVSGGFVIVAADDIYTPIIGYSVEGSFPAGGSNKSFSSFIQEYADQIGFGRQNGVLAENSVVQAWDYYSNMTSARLNPEGDRDVEPLLAIMWNQDYPYNAYCPEDEAGPGGHVYAGCVATAMSMIMAYYRYPEQGSGSLTYNCPGYGNLTANFGQTNYNWDAMLNSVLPGSGVAVNAVAELQYHCGVSVRMEYGPDGSGAFSNDVPAAIKNYFGYSTTAQYAMKMSYTNSAWENMIIQSIDEMKPLYYSGKDPNDDAGHAFVCDGYQVTGTGKLFHFNFGWSGSGNGFFALTSVGGFSSNQAMVRNFFPNPANYPYQCDSHVITSPLGIFEDRSGPLANYLPNSTCSWLIAPTDSVTSISLNFNRFELAAGDSVKIYAGSGETAPLLASYGQNSSTAQVTSPGNRMLVKLLTDGSNEGSGFEAEFNSVFPVYCTNSVTNLTEPTGFFSDGSGDYNYNNNSICKWKINPGDGAKDLTLIFSSFDLETDVDFLKVYAIPTNQLIGNFTGNTIPGAVVSPTGQMMIVLSTNGYNNYQGFDAEYYISNVGTTEKDFARNLAVYPNPASGYTEVKFNLNQQTKVEISLFNLLGNQVFVETAQMQAGFVSKMLQLGNLSSGVYLLRISSENGSLTRRLVVE
ncbi:MAG: C10 family peptidase [Bacteroidota bacterium]